MISVRPDVVTGKLRAHAARLRRLVRERQLATATEAGRHCAQQMLALPSLERLFHEHSLAFSYPPERLESIVIDGLADKVSWRATLEAISDPDEGKRTDRNKALGLLVDGLKVIWQNVRNRKWRAGAEPTQTILQRDELALVLEHLGDFDRALRLRRDIARDRPSRDNSFAVGRLLELKGAGEEIHAYYATELKDSQSQFLLALARRMAFANPSEFERKTLTEIAANVRGAAELRPDDLALRLALGFVELADGQRARAKRHFSAASTLIQKGRSAGFASSFDCDSWSLNYALAYLVDPDPNGPSGRSIFPTIDQASLAIACGRMFRSEGAILTALNRYGTALSWLVVDSANIPSRHLVYGGYRVTYYREHWVAVPPSIALPWILPRTLSQRLRLATPATESGRPGSAGLRRWLPNAMKHLLRRAARCAIGATRRLPGGNYALAQLARLRYAMVRALAPSLGIMFGSDLNDLMKQIDRIEPTKNSRY